jgi:pimeloyl-ACP methyl ester carboxylesterase
MLVDIRLEASRFVSKRSHYQFRINCTTIMVLWCLLSLCLVCGCIHTDEIRYLSAAEIQEVIIGSSLTDADSGDWKEDYLTVDGDKLTGNITGRSKSSMPYRGMWSIVGDSMCVEYPTRPGQGGCFHFSKETGNKILWFDEAGALVFQSDLIERNKANGVATELTIPAFRQETVTFQHGENSLGGTLSLPTGRPPYPVILFVHGSGPTSRHMSFFQPIRYEFLRRGFATLIWSKPGVDESTGDYLAQSMDDRAAEVAAAMAHLAERADIDGDQIGLWGISQAGWVMPMVPAHRDVAFVIAVSGSVQTGLEQTLYLADNLMASVGASASDRADAREDIRAFAEMIRMSATYDEFLRGQEEWLAEVGVRSWYPGVRSNLGQALVQQGQLPIDRRKFEFFATFLANDAPPQLKNLHMPLLAIYGTRDIVVDWKLGAKIYEEVSRAAGNSDVTVRLSDGADHTLMLPDNEGYLDFAPGFLTTMGEWLAERR